MQILLIPDSNNTGNKTCMHHRQVLLVGFLLVIVLPVLVGTLSYEMAASLDRAATPTLNPEYLMGLEQGLREQKEEVKEAKLRTEAHLNALALRLGKIQSQVLRVNALGQRLTAVAGLDKGEFNFREDPAVGGPEKLTTLPGLHTTDFTGSLEKLSAQIEEKFEELGLLEALMRNRRLQASLDPVGWPVVGGYVSSRFGYRRDPFNGRKAFHQGVDIANKLGASVKAMASGVVTYSGEKAGYGNMVEINHGNGYMTRYAHTLENLVEVGDKIDKGEWIARVGTSGRSTGPHLHFEILRKNRAINPRKKLRASR